jgi:hypothetical protein
MRYDWLRRFNPLKVDDTLPIHPERMGAVLGALAAFW